jgi:hypothetical protein
MRRARRAATLLDRSLEEGKIMKRIYRFGLIVSTILTFAATYAEAQTTANGPYYATPSWDQSLPASTRFIVLSNFNNQAVLDRETGLVWERSPSLSGSWAVVSAQCIARTNGGRFGWRLPTIQELGSLLDPTATSLPPLPAGHPFIGISGLGQFWSATESVLFPGDYYFALWDVSDVSTLVVQLHGVAANKSTLSGWCVRGGLQAAPQ